MRKALRAAETWDDTDLDFGLTKSRVVSGDDDVALHGDLAAATQRDTGHRGDHRLTRASYAFPILDGLRQIQHLLDVGAGGKRFFGAGQDNATNIVIGIECAD